MLHRLARLLVVTFLIVLAAPPPARVSAAAAPYTLTDLGMLPGGTQGVGVSGFNDAGEAVGFIQTDLTDPQFGPQTHAIIWRDGAVTDLNPLLPGGPDRNLAECAGVNATGDAIGDFNYVGATGSVYHRFLYRGGTFGYIDALIATYGINDADQVVGQLAGADSYAHAALWDQGTVTDLGFADRHLSVAWAINNHGQIAGAADDGAGNDGAIIWDHGAHTWLGALPGGKGSQALAINDAGQAVGWSHTDLGPDGTDPTGQGFDHAALWQRGTVADLGVPPGATVSHARAINIRGEIVGYAAYPFGPQLAVRFGGGAPTLLDDLIPADSGWTLVDATGINAAGQIVGAGSYKGQFRAFLLTPARPTVARVSPPTGPIAGGARVTITGTGFDPTTRVSFDGVTASGITIDSPTQLTATTPAHPPGSVAVTVATVAGAATLPGAYTYASPAPAPAARPGGVQSSGGAPPGVAPPPRAGTPAAAQGSGRPPPDPAPVGR